MDRGGSSSDSTGRKQRQEKIKDGQTREEDVATVDLFSFKTPPSIGRQCWSVAVDWAAPALLMAHIK